MIKPIILLFLSIFSACTNIVYQGKDVLGPEEFVLDSYQILEDKTPQDRIVYSIKNRSPQKNVSLCADNLDKALSLMSKEVHLSKSYLIRDSQLLPIDLIKNQGMEQNTVFKRGDKIYIIKNSNIMMLGDVKKECIIDVSNGFIPLKEALSHAGVLASKDKAYIQIIRGNILQPKIYTLHLKYVINLPEHSMVLIPGDIVYVATKPISGLNFVVNELLPNFIAFDLLKKRSSLEITIE